MEDYNFYDHLHNYAVWTAARAVQRKFTKTKNIKSAIEATDLKELSQNPKSMTIEQFDNFHRITSHIIIEHLNKLGIKASYGQAAKIIAIYLKTSLVIQDSGQSQISKIAHPPIDNILLTNLNRNFPSLGLKGIRWTQLSEENYFSLIGKLRSLNLDSFWKLEKYWQPDRTSTP